VSELTKEILPPAAAPRTWFGGVHPIVPWLLACAILAPVPLLMNNAYTQFVVNVMMINIILAVGLNIVKGFAGQVTVGHVALMAIGAYASAVVSVKFGFPFWVALPSAMLITAVAGALVGIPALRLEGAYLALATLGLAESVRIFISGTEYLGAAVGFENIPPPYIGNFALSGHSAYYYIVMPAALLGLYFSFSILSSDIGRAFKSIREDALAAAASGVNVPKYKVVAFVISALYAGAAGSLMAHMSPGFLHPNNYTIEAMVTLLLMVIAGGIGHIWGGVVGAIVVTIVDDFSREYYTTRMLIFGMTIVLVVIFMPRGIGGIIDDFIVRRRFKAIRDAKQASAPKAGPNAA
jgi:branched-chain amino acid transport system permease protein